MADLTGKTLGKYRLVERLGRGGMAEVYRAYQPRLDRYVAVKLMHAYLADDEGFVGRFQREAKAIAALRHPHIVQVHDFDIEDDVYYMVQEYVEGGTLKTKLRETSERGEIIPIEETLRIFKAICSAVDYAHAQGRIHRDIKPDNIMFDANDRPVLTDFGIASIVGGTRFTATGAMIGTPAYMSPEQGKGEPNDARSDIYSLGVVLYEMVTGRIPFDADTPFAVVLKHVNEALPLPRAVNPDVSPGVERVILRALAKDPDDRYQTAEELARDLEEAVQESEVWDWSPPAVAEPVEEVVAAPEIVPGAVSTEAVAVPAEATPKPARKRKVWPWVLVVAAGLMLLTCCLTVVANRFRQRGANATATVLASDGTTTVATKEVVSDPTATKGTASEPTATRGAASDVSELIQAGNEILGEECDGDVEDARALFERAIEQDEAAVDAYVGRARCSACYGESQDALVDLNKAVELDSAYAPAYFWRGRLWMDQEDGEKALADLTRAVDLDPSYVEAYYWRGLLAIWALDDCEQVFADMSKVIELAPDFAPAYVYRGQASVWCKDDTDAALADFSRLIELQPDSPEGYAERGEVYLEYVADYEKAVAEYTKAIERNPDYAYYYLRRAWAYWLLEQFSSAIEDYTRALDVEPDAQTYFYRGMAYYATEQYEAALADFDKALLLGWEYEDAAYHAKGWVYHELERYEDAIEAYSQAAENDWEDYAWPFFEGNPPLLDRAIAYRDNEQFQEALNDLETLIEGRDGWFRPYYERAMVYKEMGEDEKALEDLRQAWEYVDDDEWRGKIEEAMESLRAESAE